MTVKNTQILLELLDSGQIDFAVVEGEFPKSQYAHQQFCVEEFIPICGKNYSLQDGELSFQELFQEPLLLREEGSGTRHILEQAMQNAGYAFGDFSNVITIENMHVIKELVSSNCGITFLYRSAVEQELADGKLRRIPMKDFSLWHEISFVGKKIPCSHRKFQKYCSGFNPDIWRVKKKLEKTGKQNGKCAIIMSDYLPNGEVRIFM